MSETNHKNGAEKKEGWLLRLWQKLKEAFSSTLMKYLLGLLVTSVVGFIGNETFYNPMIRFELSGRVVLHDYPEQGVEDAIIYVEGKTFEAKTNEDGVFSGSMKIRKRSGAITIHCEKYGFEPEHKTVYIPLEKNPRQRTYFILKPL